MSKNNKLNQLGHVLLVVNLHGQWPNLDKKKYTAQINLKTRQLCQIISTKSNMEDLYDKKTIVMQKFTHTRVKWKENNCT
jgi:hypothetical protein